MDVFLEGGGGGGAPLRCVPGSVNTSREVSERRARARALQGPPLCLYLSTSPPNSETALAAQVAHRRAAGAVFMELLSTYRAMNDPDEAVPRLTGGPRARAALCRGQRPAAGSPPRPRPVGPGAAQETQ